MVKRTHWSDLDRAARNELILGHCEKGEAYTKCVVKLGEVGIYGITRHAISSHVSRNMSGTFHFGRRQKKSNSIKARQTRVSKKPQPKKVSRPVEMNTALDGHTPKDPRILADLPAKACHFPLWGDEVTEVSEMKYCADPALDGRSYCEFHQRRMVQQRPAPQL